MGEIPEEENVQSIYLEVSMSVDSQTHTWDDLTEGQKLEAMRAAVSAYDKFEAWDRNSDMTQEEFNAYRKAHPNLTFVVEDITVVRGAKADPHKPGVLKGKIRIAPRRFNDRTWESVVYSTSPTVSQSSVRQSDVHGMRAGLLQIEIDFSDAFFQTFPISFFHGGERVVVIKVTDGDLIPGASKQNPVYRRLLKETPGCKNAGRRWYSRISQILTEFGGYSLASFDKSYFIKFDTDGKLCGLIPLHVDDAKCRLTAAEFEFLKVLFQKHELVLNYFRIVPLGTEVEFCGYQFLESEEGIEIHQRPYIERKLQQLPKISSKAEDALDSQHLGFYGKAVGQLIWILPSNPRDAYEITFLSRFRTCANVGLYKRLSQLIYKIKEKPGCIFLPRFRPQYGVKTILIGDASSGEVVPNLPVKARDHGCQLCCLAEATPPGEGGKVALVASHATKLGKISHSSFDSEAINNVDSLDLAININEMSTEHIFGICPSLRSEPRRSEWVANRTSCELHSDAQSFIRVVRLNLIHTLSRRRARDIEDCRVALETGDLSAYLHIAGVTNPADVGTKRHPSPGALATLTDLAERGRYVPQVTPLGTSEIDTSEVLHLIQHCLKISIV